MHLAQHGTRHGGGGRLLQHLLLQHSCEAVYFNGLGEHNICKELIYPPAAFAATRSTAARAGRRHSVTAWPKFCMALALFGNLRPVPST